MGFYKLMSRRHNNAPAYQQLNTVSGKQSCYIYKYDADTWLGGLKLGSSSGYLYNRDSSPAPPISGWQYGKNGKWASDSLLSVIAITDTLKLICPSITINARWDSAGRPVYTNSNNKFLFVDPDGVDWIVADNIETAGAVMRSDPASGLCPASERCIRYWDGEEWKGGYITVTCNIQNISC